MAASSAMSGRKEEEHNDGGIKVGLFYADHEGARRCGTTGMLVRNVCSFQCGTSALGSERLEPQRCPDEVQGQVRVH